MVNAKRNEKKKEKKKEKEKREGENLTPYFSGNQIIKMVTTHT